MIQLDKLCALSQLDLSSKSESAKAQLTRQLEEMVALANKVQSASLEGIAPLYHPLELTQPLREDFAQSTEGFRDALLTNAPQHDSAFFLVPKVIE